MIRLDTLPMAPGASRPMTLNAFAPWEAIRPNPPRNQLQNIFHLHVIEPKDY